MENKCGVLESPAKQTQTWRVFLDKRKTLLRPNRDIIEHFLSEKAGIVKSRRSLFSAVYDAVRFLEHIGKPLGDLTREDVINYMNVLSRNASPTPKTNVCAFLKWRAAPLEQKAQDAQDSIGGRLTVGEKKSLRELRACIKYAKESRKSHNGHGSKLPQDMLTMKDIEQMLNGLKMRCRSPAMVARDQAVVAFLFDTGCRAGELANAKLRSIRFDQAHVEKSDGKEVSFTPIKLEGKTGERQIYLSESLPYVKAWLNHHPDPDNPNAHLFLTSKQHPLQIQEVERVVAHAKEGAGIKKRVHPHLFRHSRASQFAETMTEQELKAWFGWSGGSRQCATYVHLSGQSLLNKRKKAMGIETQSKRSSTLAAERLCPKCGAACLPTIRFCGCGTALDANLASKIEEAKEVAHAILAEALKEIQAQREADQKRMAELERLVAARG